MIQSAEEFVALRISDLPEEQNRATHEEAPLDVWKDVIEKYPDYVRWVIHNKTVPLEILEILSEIDDASIRYWVATKRKLSLDLFERLSKDKYSEVRTQIAINKKLPLYLLERLCDDEDHKVANTAKSMLRGRTTGVWL
jgi:hypothetical protein